MKRIVSALLALAVSATLVLLATNWKRSVTAVHAQGGCTAANLSGNYAFINPGFTTPNKSVTGHEDPFAVMGVFVFDGAGGISVSYTFALKGVAHTGQTGSGTYTVNSDCTGSISFTTGDAAGVNFNTAIIGGGTELFGIVTTPTFTGDLDAKKQ